MVRKIVKEKEVITHLKDEGFTEISDKEKTSEWYKEALRKQSCFKETLKKKIKI